MTNSETASPPAKPVRSVFVQSVILALLGLLLIFCIGAVLGFFAEVSKHGALEIRDYVIGAALLLVAAICAWQLISRTIRLVRKPREKVGPSVLKVQRLWMFFIALGLVLGAAVALINLETTSGHPQDLVNTLYSSAPISPVIAAVILAALALTCIASGFYYRYIDEHDRAAQETASLVAINFYFALVMGWFVAAKGGLAPPIDHGHVFIGVFLVWTAAWLWRRYR